MFERFSSGYYLGRLYVEPADTDAAAISRAQHERVNQQLYASGDGVERLDRPLVMKLDTTHFPVTGDDGVPPDTLAVPDDLLDTVRVENPPTLREVLLAKADRAKQLLDLTRGPPNAGDTPADPDPSDGDDPDAADGFGGPAF